MNKVALVVDSTADLTAKMQGDFNVHVIPLSIHFGQEVLYDGQLTSAEFYIKLMSSKVHPTTAPPTPEDFQELYGRLFKEYDEIVSIHISQVLSQTIVSARAARDNLGATAKIHVVDSGTASLGIAFQVAEAARLIQQGKGGKEVSQALERVREKSETVFTLDTTKYLEKGGRIGRLAGLIGGLLNIKPIIRVNKDGHFEPIGKARSQDKALEQMLLAIDKIGQGRRVIGLGVMHGSERKAAQQLLRQLEEKFRCQSTWTVDVGPVIGVHTGPGAIGMAVLFE